MRIVVAGGTGFLGRRLVGRLAADGHDVTVLTRSSRSAVQLLPHDVHTASWDGRSVGGWSQAVDGADAVVNLAGESIAGRRWSPEVKSRLLLSRLEATAALVRAIAGSSRRPYALVNASAVGFYGHVPDGDVTESRSAGTDFLADLCRRWEAEARKSQEQGTRVVILRIGIVLAADGGALQRMVLPFRFFVGGPLGSGRQWVPWVHVEDVISAVRFALLTPSLAGPYNVAAPEPVTMSDFCRAIAAAMRRPSWLRVPEFALRLTLGEMSVVVLGGQRAVPARLTEAGFQFAHARLDDALAAVLLPRP